MKKIIFCVLILINTVSAFSSGKKDPYWISNPYDGYSADKFIVACGSGTTNDDATKKAISEVSSVLKQDTTISMRFPSTRASFLILSPPFPMASPMSPGFMM